MPKCKRGSFFAAAAWALAATVVVAAPREEDLARRLLEAAGVQGGVVVHLGCGDGRLIAALGAGEGMLAHGLDRDAAHVIAARATIQQFGLAHRVWIDRLTGDRLPYADNVVNLLVVSRNDGRISKEEMLRALAPRGVAMLRGERAGAGSAASDPRGGTSSAATDAAASGASSAPLPAGWTRLVKPWPADIDEWTHYLHGPDGNQVAADTAAGPPRGVKWLASPYWGRDHRYGNQTAMVSARGRLFYVGNDVPSSSIELLPDRPVLIARDALNGVLLWKRPIFPRSFPDRMQSAADPDEFFLYEPKFPMELKVVAAGDRLYLAFGRHGEIQALDAARGTLEKVYAGTEFTEEILYSGGTLLAVGASSDEAIGGRPYSMAQLNSAIYTRARGTILRAIDSRTGRTRWEYDTAADGGLNASPIIDRGRVFVIVGRDLVRLDLLSGERAWRRPLPDDIVAHDGRLRSVIYIKGPAIYDHLIGCGDVVLFASTPNADPKDRDTALHAFASETGELLWRRECVSPERAGASAFVVGEDVWVHDAQGRSQFPLIALDKRTGAERRRIDTTKVFDVGHHHCCYGNRATERFVLTGRRGVEFVDLDSGANWLHHWLRGKCRFGVLPCNGLLYSLPHACSCYPLSTLKGYAALAPASAAPRGTDASDDADDKRLEKGPAYGKADVAAAGDFPAGGDWPMHRHDERRSGSTPARVPARNLQRVWSASLGGTLTGLTSAGGRLFVAQPDTHRLHALDIRDGGVLWTHVAGGPIDSPPTLYNGLVLFGSADGYVTCLRAADGQLVWRFLAAPRDRRIVAYGRLESVWPVHGSVLVRDGRVFATAGRSSLLDGGIRAVSLDARTGRLLAQHLVYDAYPKAEAAMLQNTGHDFQGQIGVLQDLLVGDGRRLWLRQLELDANLRPQGRKGSLLSTNGLLHPAWMSRLGWFFGQPTVETRKTNADRTKFDILQSVRQGQYLVFDDQRTYCVRVHPNVGKFSQSFMPGGQGYQVFADDNRSPVNLWRIAAPIRVEAMAAAGAEVLFMAGAPDIVAPKDPWGAMEGRNGGRLQAVSARTGEQLSACRLDSPPVFDGMMAARGGLFLSLQDGTVIRLQGE